MPSLDVLQRTMMMALDHGPDHLPGGLFTGGRLAGLRGMKVHANTISHARLIALEETFPRTLAHIGHAKFNTYSRQYLEWSGVAALPLALIGQYFPDFLVAASEPPATTDQAVFEWAWLESYHAVEAVPLALGDLAGIDEASLMNVPLVRHPAAQVLRLDPFVIDALGDENPAVRDAIAIILVRPHAEVLISSATAAMAEIFENLREPTSICNLLAGPYEPAGEGQGQPDEILPALISLIEAGTITKAD